MSKVKVDARTRKAAAKAIRKAVAKMNDNGRHWMQRSFRGVKYVKGEWVTAYCMVGGLRAVSRPGSSPQQVALIELARVIDPITIKNAIEYVATPTANVSPSYVYDVAYGIVTCYNDAATRRWPQVKRTMTKAAEALEK